MAVRLHFTDDDRTHLRLAQAPDPLREAPLSMHVLRTDTASAVSGPWRRASGRCCPPRANGSGTIWSNSRGRGGGYRPGPRGWPGATGTP
jgi:hypothetical protein